MIFKKFLLSIGMIFSALSFIHISAFSQVENFKKYVFTYKTVHKHPIKANIFLTDKTSKQPVVIYFHGGGFIFGNRDQGLPDILRDKLLENNYAVVSADYRLAPETKLAGIVEDVRDIVIWLKINGEKQFSIDSKRMAVMGGSAAGYLALSTGLNEESPPQAVIAVSTPTDYSKAPPIGDEEILKQPGPYDIVKDKPVSYGDYSSRMDLWRFLVKNQLALPEIFGFDVSQNQDRLNKFMLTEQITRSYPPTLLVHARNDYLVPLQQVEKFHSFLENKGIHSELYLVENGHNTELIKNNPDALQRIIKFLDKCLKGN